MEEITITIESRGKTLVIGSGSTLGLLAHSGFDSADREYDIVSNGASDGGYVTKKRLASRELSITTDTGFFEPHAVRENLVRFLNAADTALITVTRNGITRHITAYSSSVEIDEKNMYAPATVKLGFIAPYPYFYGAEKSASTRGQSDGFRIPMALPPTVTIGVVQSVKSTGLMNSGDEQTGFRARLEFNLVTSAPKIQNETTGEYIQLSGDFAPGDIVEISTVNGSKTITMNGVSITNRLTIGSTFFQLVPGYNVVGFSGDDNSRAYNLAISFNELFLGI